MSMRTNISASQSSEIQWVLHDEDIYAIIESMNKRLIIDNNILEIREKFYNIPEKSLDGNIVYFFEANSL